MPELECANGKWRVGKGACRFESKEKAEEAMAAMHAGVFTEAENAAGREHVAVLNSVWPGNHESRHMLEPGLDVVQSSAPGDNRPYPIAYAFDVKVWEAERALEWLLTHTHGSVLRFVKASGE